MSFKNNGSKRNLKYVLGSIFMVFVGAICLYIAASTGWKFVYTVVGIVITGLGILMFKNANEI